MKALTLYQPWATLVAIGAKKIETRSWRTNYRGPLAIHAGKNISQLPICCTEPFLTILKQAGYLWANGDWVSPLPKGCILATCDLVDCVLMDEKFLSDPVYSLGWSVSHPETAFGYFKLGRYAWMLDNVKIPPKPIQAKGAIGLWEWLE
jgi:activating signal cointegrator 1